MVLLRAAVKINCEGCYDGNDALFYTVQRNIIIVVSYPCISAYYFRRKTLKSRPFELRGLERQG